MTAREAAFPIDNLFGSISEGHFVQYLAFASKLQLLGGFKVHLDVCEVFKMLQYSKDNSKPYVHV